MQQRKIKHEKILLRQIAVLWRVFNNFYFEKKLKEIRT